MGSRKFLLAFFCLLSLGTSSLYAQVTTAGISGSVIDPEGVALIGATVLATHAPSGTTYGTTTRPDGGYDLPNMRVGGPYQIEVSYVGYETQTLPDVYLKLGQKLVLNFDLESQATQLDIVTVTAGGVLGGDRTGAETNVSSEALTKLPTISRSAADYYRLTPASDGNSFAGRNDQFNNFSVDGSIFNNPFGLDAATPGGQTDAQPISLDAIEEITVSLAPYDVTQAGFTGAAVNAVTKSGTNNLAGTVYGFFRNQDLTGSKVAGYLHNTNSTKAIAKLDFAISKSHSLALTYNFLDAFKDKPAHPSAIGRRGPDFTTLQFQNSGYRINNTIHSGILEWRALFGNKLSNKLQLGYAAFIDSRDPFSEPFPVINISQDGSRYIVAGHEPFSIHNRLDQNVLQVTDNFNIYAGDHTLTIGTSFEKFDFDNSFNLNAYGGTFPPDFVSVDAFVDSVNTGAFDDDVANAEALFEANGGDEGVEGEGWALAETNIGQWAFYVQDEWAATEKLNLTVGVRMDMPLYFDTPEKIQENIDRNCCYDPNITWYDTDGNPQMYDHTVLPKQTPLFSPRIGFNYMLNKGQLRGGTGLFSGRLPFVWIGNHVANPNSYFYNYTETNFKFPQVWRSNLGIDQTIGNGWLTTIDLIYTKDINASMVRNHGLKPPTGNLKGVDNREIYTLDDHPAFFNAYVFTNTDIGYSFNASIQVQKSLANDLYLMLGYNYLMAEDASSIEAEISSDAYDRNPALGHVNIPVSSPSLYGNKHRVLGAAYKTWKYGNWATTVSTFFQYAQAGTTQNDNTADFRFSYTYSGDLNNDGSFLNDLIYIPTDSELDQMDFVSDEQREAFRDYIEQDEYLSDNRGSYAEKYAVVAPWYSQWDVRILQDLDFGKAGSLQLSIDILNFGNLISSNWGVKQLPSNTQPVGVSVAPDGTPTYSFDPSLTSTFVNDFSLLSRWQTRVGLRYSFKLVTGD
ncbi:MAG: TonB-dependent receptor [Saprospirales bacterium]|nr:TonB-dependent receptor [Saprospirales bacterium]